MSPKQNDFYFTLWNRVCVEQGWYHLSAAEKRSERMRLHLQAGCKYVGGPKNGEPKSSKDFTNADFDRYKAECQKLIAGLRHGGDPRVVDDGQRRRLVWRIKDDAKKAGLDAAYIAECARDLHVLGNWQDLDLDSLTNLMKTIHNRAGKKLGRDTRNVDHKPSRRHYVMDAVPRMFDPRPVTKHVTAPHNADNEPF